MAVTISIAGNEIVDEFLVGQPVSAIFANKLFCERMNIQGNEAVEVESAGADGFVSVNHSYVIQEDDFVNLSRPDGTKG